MTIEQSEKVFRSFLGRRPFQPFVLEMDDGRRIVVDNPQAFGFAGGAIGFIGPDEIYLLRVENVVDVSEGERKPNPS
jgi:hypothetical protein